MKSTAFIFAWKENGKVYQKEINRADFFAMFDGLAKGYKNMGDNANEISKKLANIIPEVDRIFIDMDNNETQDVPSVQYLIKGKDQLLKIRRRHRIVWSILNDYCTE